MIDVRLAEICPVEERTVRDLWPLGLMRDRAGVARTAVAVARPRDAGQVSDLLRWAESTGTRVVPLGGGSAVTGTVAPEPGQVVLDLGAFDRILEVDPVNLLVRTEAGVNGLVLQERLESEGLTLGHFPSSLPVATVGGLVATRSSGQESSRWGSVEDMVQGLRVVLPDGRVLEPRPGPRSAAGPALHQLWVGAEGGLGVVLEAVLRIHRRPQRTVGRGWRLEDVEAGLEAARAVMQAGLRPLVLRLYDPDDTAFQGVLEGGCLLVVAVAGPAGVAEAEAAHVASLLGGAADLGEEPWEHWRRHRFDLSAERLISMLEPPGSYVDTIELASTWTSMPALYSEVKAHLGGLGVGLCHFSHAYEQGVCAYFTFAGAAGDEAGAEASYREAWRGTIDAALRHGATISHHHGVGLVRAPWIGAEMGGWREVWERVRDAIDPAGAMNPNAVGGRRR